MWRRYILRWYFVHGWRDRFGLAVAIGISVVDSILRKVRSEVVFLSYTKLFLHMAVNDILRRSYPT